MKTQSINAQHIRMRMSLHMDQSQPGCIGLSELIQTNRVIVWSGTVHIIDLR